LEKEETQIKLFNNQLLKSLKKKEKRKKKEKNLQKKICPEKINKRPLSPSFREIPSKM